MWRLLALLLLIAFPASAQTFTRQMLFQQNNQSFFNNSQGYVHPSTVNGMNQNMIQAFGLLNDTNTWTGTNIFTGPITIHGVTVDIISLGVVVDGYSAADATISSSSATMSAASRACVAGDVGKIVVIAGAGAASAPLHTTVSFCSGTSYVLAATASTSVTANTNAASWAIGTDNTPVLATNPILAAGNVIVTMPCGQVLLDARSSITLNGVTFQGCNIPQNRSAALGQAVAKAGSSFLITGTAVSPFIAEQGNAFLGVTVFYPGQAGVTATPVSYPPLIGDDNVNGIGDFTWDRSNCVNCYDFLSQANYGLVMGAVRIVDSNIYAIRYPLTLSNIGEQVSTVNSIFNSSVYYKVVAAGSQYLGIWTATNGKFAEIIGNGTSSVCSTTTAGGLTIGSGTVIAGYANVLDVETGHLDEMRFDGDANSVGQLIYVAPAGLLTDTIWSGLGIQNGAYSVVPSHYAFDFEGTCGTAVGNVNITGKLGSLKGGGVENNGTNMVNVTFEPSSVQGVGPPSLSAPLYLFDAEDPNTIINISGVNVTSFFNTQYYEGINFASAASINVSACTFDNFYIPFDLSNWAAGTVNIQGNTTTGSGSTAITGVVNETSIRVGPGNKFDKSNSSFPQRVRQTVAESVVSYIMAPSGSVGNNGALTLGTNLDHVYANAYMYMPAGAIAASGPGSAAGAYYAQCSSVSSCTLFNNTYSSGSPRYNPAPTAFVTTGPGAYTQATGVNEGLLFTILANQLGVYDGVTTTAMVTYNNSSNNKIFTELFGNSGQMTLCSYTATTTAQFSPTCGFWMSGQIGVEQVAGTSSGIQGPITGSVTVTGSVDTTIAEVLGIKVQLAVATDWAVIQSASVEQIPGY